MTTAPSAALLHAADSPDAAWWRHAVIYQIYPRSWADATGDGVGDLPGITARLPHLAELGVDAIWISPFYVSPMADAGYDVADYFDIDPLFGTLADADALLVRARELGIRVVVDLVPNHSSDEHAWFQAALAAAPGSPERARYIFRDGRGPDGSQPPNNWKSVFGGKGWTRVPEADGAPGQWYLHLFDVKQPDFDWQNPEVREMFHDVLRFWLDRGVDGFRVDVAHALVKDPALPDWTERTTMLGDAEPTLEEDEDEDKDDVTPAAEREPTSAAPMWDKDEVHDVYRAWRSILNSYNPEGDPQQDKMLVAEAWVEPVERAVRYIRPDEMHQTFNFDFMDCTWRARDLRRVITGSLSAADSVGAPTTWVLSNHDVVRHASRLGLPVGPRRPNGIGLGDPQPNAVLGLRRARAATALMLALPGSAYLYQGEELGLPDHTALPDDVRQDPTWLRSGHTERGRDGCRIPFPWEAGSPSFGFGAVEETWLPQPELYGALAVDRQQGVSGSTLELYRELLRLRREYGLGTGSLEFVEGWPTDVVAVRNGGSATAGPVTVLVNLGTEPVTLPADQAVLVTSRPVVAGAAGPALPSDTTVWLAG